MITKICTVCNREKNVDLFHKTKRNKTGYVAQCKECRSFKMHTLYKESESRRTSIGERNKVSREYNRRLLSKYKAYCGCQICREKEPVVLDLHHIDPSIKEGDPSSFAAYSTEKLKREIRKCIVLCSNCHRKVHAGLISICEISSVD